MTLAGPGVARRDRAAARRIDLAVALPALAATLLAGAIFWAPLPVAALAALAFVGIAARAPLPALALVVVSLPFYLLGRPVGRYSFGPTELLIVLSTAAYGVRLLARWAVTRKLTSLLPLPGGEGGGEGEPGSVGGSALTLSRGERGQGVRRSGWFPIASDRFVAVLLVVFVGVAALSLTASVAFHESLQSFRVVIVEPAIFYVLAVNQARGRRDAAALALALVLAGVLISLVGGWQYLTNDRIITAEAGLRRIRGFYGSPNNLGLFLGRALPMAVALALWWRGGRTLVLAAVAVMAIALVLTFSIGAWVAVGGSLLVVAALRGRRALGVATATGLAALVVLVVAALRIPRIGAHFDLSWGTSFIRLNVWESALRMLADHPLRGVGLDNFLTHYQNGYRLPTAWQDPDMSHPHNFVLDVWLSLGLPGILVFGLLLGRFAELVRGRWARSSSFERGLYAGAVGMLADTLLHGAVDNSFFLVDLAVLFWLDFAIVTILARSSA